MYAYYQALRLNVIKSVAKESPKYGINYLPRCSCNRNPATKAFGSLDAPNK